MAQSEGTIAIREGSFTAMEYTLDLLKFLYVRTGFRYENFTTPRALQQLLREVSFNRVPKIIWHELMSAALRICRVGQTVGQGVCEFGALFIDVVVWITKRFVNMGLFKFGIFLFNFFVNPLVKAVVVIITLVVNKLLEPLWVECSKFLKSRLPSAPRHHHLAINL